MARIVRTKEFSVVKRLNDIEFPGGDQAVSHKDYWWLLLEEGEAIGFAGLDPVTGFLSRAWIHPDHRRKGYHSRLIDCRVREARKLKRRWAWTYTQAENVGSANSLIKKKFRLFIPSWFHDEEGAWLYWKLDL